MRARTEKSKFTFYPNCLFEWNKLEPELRLTLSIAVLKKKLLSIIYLPENLSSEFTIQYDYPILLNSGLIFLGKL